MDPINIPPMLVYIPAPWILWEWRIFDQFLKAELEIDGNSLELSLELSCFIAPFGQWEQNTEMPRYVTACTSAVSCTDRRRLSLHNKSRLVSGPSRRLVSRPAVNTFWDLLGATDPFLSRGVQLSPSPSACYASRSTPLPPQRGDILTLQREVYS